MKKKTAKYLLCAGLFSLALGLILIPLDLNGTYKYIGYTGEHQFTASEYSEFKRAVIAHSDPDSCWNNPFRLLSEEVTVIDAHEPILVKYQCLRVQEGFPYGRKIAPYRDGQPFGWLKVLLMPAGLILSIVGMNSLLGARR